MSLAHLASAERGHQQVIAGLLAGQETHQPGFDLDAFNETEVGARRGMTTEAVFDELASSRAATLALLDTVGPGRLGAIGLSSRRVRHHGRGRLPRHRDPREAARAGDQDGAELGVRRWITKARDHEDAKEREGTKREAREGAER